jgi:cyclopropane fatty-acyl-phospholipid synthase-like methyltransferase
MLQKLISKRSLRGKGMGVTTAATFDEESSSMIHEQLARLVFAESKIHFDGLRVLDFGCGTGYNLHYLSDRHQLARAVGVDISEDCIEHCRTHYPGRKIEYHVRDCLVLDQELGQFEAAICCEVLEHVTDQGQFLEVLKGYLVKKGLVFISTPNKGLFSLSKSRSFLNKTHLKELYFHEFDQLLRDHFGNVEIYSQIHSPMFHDAYINYLCAMNLANTMRHESINREVLAKWMSYLIKSALLSLLCIFKSKDYPDIRERRFEDFDFIKGHDTRAVWFIGICVV